MIWQKCLFDAKTPSSSSSRKIAGIHKGEKLYSLYRTEVLYNWRTGNGNRSFAYYYYYIQHSLYSNSSSSSSISIELPTRLRNSFLWIHNFPERGEERKRDRVLEDLAIRGPGEMYEGRRLGICIKLSFFSRAGERPTITSMLLSWSRERGFVCRGLIKFLRL